MDVNMDRLFLMLPMVVVSSISLIVLGAIEIAKILKAGC